MDEAKPAADELSPRCQDECDEAPVTGDSPANGRADVSDGNPPILKFFFNDEHYEWPCKGYEQRPLRDALIIIRQAIGLPESIEPKRLLSRRLLALLILAACCLIEAACAKDEENAASPYRFRLIQQDTRAFPHIRSFLSVTDANGNALPDNVPISLTVYEDGKQVSQKTLSDGWSISCVLVLDISGSMSGEKLRKAKEAAINCIRQAPPSYKLAVVAFSSHVSIIGRFNDSREVLCNRINDLSEAGKTALQDAVGVALDLLHNEQDRRAITVLTDGIENASTLYQAEAGHQALIERAKSEGGSISVIGLGDDVQQSYLKTYEDTGGVFLLSPTADQLKQIFGKAVSLLQKEILVEYNSLLPVMDGAVKRVSFELSIKDVKVRQDDQYTRPGVIPHVRGNHLPWLIAILFMLCIPDTLSLIAHVRSVYAFRRSRIQRLSSGSPVIGKCDPNEGAAGAPFAYGDLVALCPTCESPHRIRSWRMNGCKCMRDGVGKGNYCYHEKVPQKLRHLLDDLSSRHEDAETGRSWLCYCAGDKEKDRRGY